MSKFVEVTIAVPITLAIRKVRIPRPEGEEPAYVYTATFGGEFHIQDVTGGTPEDAAWRMAERLKGAFN